MSNTVIPNLLPEETKKVVLAVKSALDQKALNPVLFDVTERETFTDYIMVCHGTSDRHVQAIYESIEVTLKKQKIRAIGIEGESLCHWVLMDFGGLVVHVFYEPLREFYDIEGLCADCPSFDIEAISNIQIDDTNSAATEKAL